MIHIKILAKKSLVLQIYCISNEDETHHEKRIFVSMEISEDSDLHVHICVEPQ